MCSLLHSGGRRSTMAMIVSCLLLMQRGFLEWDMFRINLSGGGSGTTTVAAGDQQELTIVSPVVGPSALTRALLSSANTLHASTNRSLPAPVAMHTPVAGSGGAVPPISRSPSPSLGESANTSAAAAADADEAAAASSEEAQKSKLYARGEYKGIMSLLRILKYGRQVKEQVDAVIDYCGNVHNIRLAIAQARAESDVERTAAKHTEHLAQAIKYLESYAYLICFHSYLWERKYHELEGVPGTTTHSTPAHPPQNAHGAASPLPHALPPDSQTPRLHPQEPSTSHPGTIGGGTVTLNSSSSQLRLPLSQPPQLMTSSSLVGISNLASPVPIRRSPSAGNLPATPGGTGAPAAGTPFPSFHEWMRGRAELKSHLESFRKTPHEALKLDVGLSDELYTLLYENRNGNVLVRGSILKSDYFKGISAAPPAAATGTALAPTAAGHGLLAAGAHASTVPIDGAINFRLLDTFPVAGTGIPSDEGIINILRYFAWDTRTSSVTSSPPAPQSTALVTTDDGKRASLTSSGTPTAPLRARFRASGAVWINLRGEPIIYIHGRPFVLRDHDNPYLNLEHTGITKRRVEAQEKQLKKDVIAETKLYNGQLFLHDEDEDGNLASYWDQTVGAVASDKIKTPSQMFHECFLYHQQVL